MVTHMTPEMASALTRSLAELGLSVRTINCLEGQGILTLEHLLNCCPHAAHDCIVRHSANNSLGDLPPRKCAKLIHLLDIPNFGEKTLDEVFLALRTIGFKRGRAPRGT